MTDTSSPDNSQHPEKTSGGSPKESLIQVHPYAHMAPGANERCPVCGHPYVEEGLPAATTQQETEVVLADQPTQKPPSNQAVIRCAKCGTYSVGVPRSSSNGPQAEQ